jgi:precorrin-2 dehydrogenase/sirohydrochlorin ferrochelatase
MHNFPPYPLFLNLANQPVLIVGGGAVGLRKARGLADCGASVTVVSRAFEAELEDLPGIERIQRPYSAEYMARKRWRLVFAATDSDKVNALVQKHAAARGIFCCRADEPDAGDFSGGATQRSGAVVVAVSTSGASPLLAARVCREAAAGIDPVLCGLAGLLGQWRAVIKNEIHEIAIRRRLFRRLAGAEMETILRKQGSAAAERTFKKWMKAARSVPRSPRRVSLGAHRAKSRQAVSDAH